MRKTITAENTWSDSIVMPAGKFNFSDWRGSDLKASGGSISDHGALAGLTDEDHPQYSLINSGVVAPTSTPSRVGEIYIDSVAGDVYISTGTASSADWKEV